MTDVVVDRLRIRGTDARRLATVAARALPHALERALADLADVDLDRLTVRLTDPADHDDATLAVLWADGIRQAALAAGARPRARGVGVAAGRLVPEASGTPTTAGARTTPGANATAGAAGTSGGGEVAGAGAVTDVVEVAKAVSGWLARVDPGAVPVPKAVTALSDPRIAAAVLHRIGGERAETLVQALIAAAGSLRTPRQPPVTRARGSAAPLAHPPHERHAGVVPGSSGSSPSSGTAPPALADRLAEAARAVRPLLEPSVPVSVDPAAATRAAGVVLAYPWLADLCREAVDLHASAEPSLPRRVALAALADPADPGLVDDPLVRFLAGAPEDAAPSAGLAPLDALDRIRVAAEDVLRRFVALLPGFQRSSARFVRDSWLIRAGILDLGHDPATLLAQTAPLDVVLPLLPYPVGLLRLPWTPVLTVRFRP
ncbi:contractile injection system tape measure protein [Geodermatophilus sp. CPCC 205761]|uniref:contractile injection system tape measure protein n=1 Tax=Geodermatophilus sp. CPCC 205761 TaxID=2936597 RepID=UPI003EEC4DE9